VIVNAVDLVGALSPCGGSDDEMERRVLFLHQLQGGVFAHSAWPGEDNQDRTRLRQRAIQCIDLGVHLSGGKPLNNGCWMGHWLAPVLSTQYNAWPRGLRRRCIAVLGTPASLPAFCYL